MSTSSSWARDFEYTEASKPGADASSPQRPRPEAHWVTVGRNEMLAASIRISDSRDDAWLRRLYDAHSQDFDEAIITAIRAEIGTDTALFLSIESGSIYCSLGLMTPIRRRFGLDRIEDAIIKAVHLVINSFSNARGRSYDLISRMSLKIIALKKRVSNQAFTDAVSEVWGSIPFEVKTAFNKWLGELAG